jgi:Family of unknown function (DUF5681)
MSRTSGGQFEKGQSGNPGGRPRVAQSARDAARAHLSLAISTLVAACKGGSVTAAIALLDRGYGKPITPVDMRAVVTKRLDELSTEELAALEAHLEEHGEHGDDDHDENAPTD